MSASTCTVPPLRVTVPPDILVFATGKFSVPARVMLSPSVSVPAAPAIFICLPVGRSKACSIVNDLPFAKLISENSV